MIVLINAAFNFPVNRLDWPFVLLGVMTVFVSSRISIKIPRIDAVATLSDTFVFLAILLYWQSSGNHPGFCRRVLHDGSDQP
jgi:hypothetical protein